MNAHLIDKNVFGISRPELSRDNLSGFIENLAHYHDDINNDHAVLLRENGRGRIIASLSAYL